MSNLNEKLNFITKFNISGFKIVKELGVGSYGSTYLAKKGAEQIVIKKYIEKAGKANNEILIEREITNLSFVRESRLIIGFKGISFIDLNQKQNEYPLLILDYAENGSLEDLIDKKKKNLSDVEIMIILYGVAKAMQYLHSFNIIHRDLKPDNILLDKHYYPLLSDFGSSRIIDQNSQKDITPTLGTPLYMPLEVFQGEFTEDISKKTDVFSFAMIMYSLLSKKKPYSEIRNVNSYNIMKFLEAGRRFDLSDQIPSYFKQLISLAWHQNPLERPEFTDIVRLFDSGIIFKTVLEDDRSLKKYFQYTKYASNISGFDISNLNRLYTQLHDRENKLSLSFVITFFLADVLNDSNAQKEIGYHYMSGTILELNLDKGFQYLERSSNQNNEEALYLLGQAYENGNGCIQNTEKAKECFQKSADLGYQRAINQIQKETEMENVNWDQVQITIIIGSVSTGKTTLSNCLTNCYDNSDTRPTIQTIFKNICLTDENGDKYYTKICDSKGMDNGGAVLLPSFCRNADLAIVMFDVNFPKTFQEIDEWIRDLRAYNEEARLLIIGNKIDLERAIPKPEIIQKIKSYGPETKYLEISAKKQINIDIVSETIINELKKSYRDRNVDESRLQPNDQKKWCCGR